MLFNSYQYFIFFPVVYVLFWLFRKKLVLQNIMLLSASYLFYGCWSYKFLFLLIFSTLLDYFSGIVIASAKSRRVKKLSLLLSVLVNTGFLVFFKYFNFFNEIVSDLGAHWGSGGHLPYLNLILPVGISFYTFHGLSYVFDVYQGKIKAEHNFIHYGLFVCYFPLLVAGPIELPRHLLPQLKTNKQWHYTAAVSGLKQILWGMFKKVVVADNCAVFINGVFADSPSGSGSTLLFSAAVFLIQLYCDFSGYTDIALGSARLLGVELLQNFNFPLFSGNVMAFWKRWHMSLTNWFRLYLYFPLGGNRKGRVRTFINIMIVFIVSGLWHGANYTFLVWGALNGFLLVCNKIYEDSKYRIRPAGTGLKWQLYHGLSISFTFILMSLVFVWFRVPTVKAGVRYFHSMFTGSLWSRPDNLSGRLILFIGMMLFTEWTGRKGKFALDRTVFGKWTALRWCFYSVLLICIFVFFRKPTTFIYFQF